MDDGKRRALHSYETPRRVSTAGNWIFRICLVSVAGGFLAAGSAFRTVEDLPAVAGRSTRSFRTEFVVRKPPKPEPPPEPPVAREGKPDKPPAKTEKNVGDEQTKPEKKPERPTKARRVYGLRRVYAKGIGTGGSMSDAVIGKRGNTLDKEVDTLEVTEEELKGRLASAATVERAPRFRKRVRPEYTPAMLENRVQGTVRVRVLVDIDGKVKKAEALNDLGHGAADQAVRACRAMTFEPALRDGAPVAVWITIPIRFVLLE